MMMGLGLWEFAEEVVSMRMYTCTSAWVFWGGLVSGRGPTAVDEPHCYKTERLRRIALETRCGRIFTLQISNPETLINLAHHANQCLHEIKNPSPQAYSTCETPQAARSLESLSYSPKVFSEPL